MRHYHILLHWIGYGPGNECPEFWKDRELVHRISLEGDRHAAIAQCRRTWHEHEAEILMVHELVCWSTDYVTDYVKQQRGILNHPPEGSLNAM